MSEKETSEEIASIAGLILGMEGDLEVGGKKTLLHYAKRLAGSALSQRETVDVGDREPETEVAEPVVEGDLNFGDPNFMRVWSCKIGFVQTKHLPQGADKFFRRAVQEAFKEMTGREPDFVFSGWGATLTVPELDCIETDSNGVHTPSGYPYGG